MATLVTFTWEETDELSYDDLMDQLMGLGAEDIESEEIERQTNWEPTGRKKKHSTEGAVEGPPQ